MRNKTEAANRTNSEPGADKTEGRKQVGYRMEPELLKHLRVTAAQRDTSVSQLVNEAVVAFIGKPGAGNGNGNNSEAGRRKKTAATAKRAA